MKREKRPLELLYLLPAAGFGGAERQGVYHLAELPRHEVKVTAFVGPGDSLMNALRDANVDHGRFRYFPDRDHGPLTSFENVVHPVRSAALLWRSVAEIERRVRGKHFDLIFANRTFAWMVAGLLSRRLGVPYALRAGSRLAHPALALGLRALDHAARPAAAFCNCQAVEQEIAARLRCRAYPLPNAVDAAKFAPGSRGADETARNRLGLPRGVPVVGLAARPAPEKGFDFFEKVVRQVLSTKPDTRFVVAGEFGWRRRYEENMRRAGLEHSVRFLGRVRDIQDFLRAVDVVILTSRSRSIEASPNALLEAMSAERPVVATSVGGIPELVRHAQEGYLTSDDDAPGFAAHIVALLGDPILRRRMGRAGRALVLSRHQIPSVVAEFARNLRTVAPGFADRTALQTGT